MDRIIGIERTFFISNFNTMKVIENFTSIPEEVATDHIISNKIKLLMLLDIELTFRKYLKLSEKLDELPLEDSIPKLEELSSNVMGELRELLNPKEI